MSAKTTVSVPNFKTFKQKAAAPEGKTPAKNNVGKPLNLSNKDSILPTLNEKIATYFDEVSDRFEAGKSYGMQHFNREGFLHPKGITRLPNEALLLLAAQAGEVLIQRAAQAGNRGFAKSVGEHGNSSDAANAIDTLAEFFSSNAIAQIKAISEQRLAPVVQDIAKQTNEADPEQSNPEQSNDTSEAESDNASETNDATEAVEEDVALTA